MINDSIFNATTLDKKFTDSVSPEMRGTTISVLDSVDPRAKIAVRDATLHDANFAFYTTTLQKLHTQAYEPMFFVTYANDIPVETGGGFVDYVAYYTVDYAGIVDQFRNLVSDNTNYIPRVNAGLSRKQVPVMTWAVAYDLRFLDLERMKQADLQKSIQEIYQTAITAGWDLFVQNVAYTGMEGSATGLFNSDAQVEKITIDNSKATGKGFEGMDDDTIVSFFNGIFAHYLSASNMNLSVLPDTILLPTFVGRDLSDRFSALYQNSLRDYIREHNYAIDESQGAKFKVTIASRPALDTLNGGKGRIVAYRKDKKFVRLDLPYPMQHYITLPNIEKLSYTSAFVGQVSAIQLPYNTSDAELGIVTYWDFSNDNSSTDSTTGD